MAGVEQHQGHLWGELVQRVEGAVIEALDDYLVGDAVLREVVMEGGGEPLGVDGRVDFGFDHEAGLALFGEGENFGERGDAFAGD